MNKDRFKFRVWDKEKKRLFTDKDKHTDEILISTEGIMYTYFDEGIYEVEDVIIMQCTGLRDKNGKLIFESDILEWVDIDSNYLGSNIQIVKFYEFKIYPIYTAPFSSPWEIIGNIYENKELINNDE